MPEGKKILLIPAILFSFLAAAHAAEDRVSVVTDPTGFSILDAEERGMFNMGPAMGDVTQEPEPSLGKNILKFDYTIFSGAVAGVWTKNFPAALGAKSVDAVNSGVRVPTRQQLGEVSIKLEI